MLKRIDKNCEENISVLCTVNIWDKMEKFGRMQYLLRVLSAFLIVCYEILVWTLADTSGGF